MKQQGFGVFVDPEQQEGKVQQKEEKCTHHAGRFRFWKEDGNERAQRHHLGSVICRCMAFKKESGWRRATHQLEFWRCT